MPLWGSNTGSEAKPKWLNRANAAHTYASNLGWVYNRPDGTQEVLVSIGGLSTAFGNSDITAVYFSNIASSYTVGHTNSYVSVSFDESMLVTGSPTLAVTGSLPASNATATYDSGSNSSILNFKFTVPAVLGLNFTGITGNTVFANGETITQGAVTGHVILANTTTLYLSTLTGDLVLTSNSATQIVGGTSGGTANVSAIIPNTLSILGQTITLAGGTINDQANVAGTLSFTNTQVIAVQAAQTGNTANLTIT